MTGIEPVTSSLPRKRSTPELHRLSLHNTTVALANLSERPGSNRRHSAWKADALPTELLSLLLNFQLNFSIFNQFKKYVGRAGFEPAKT